MKKELVIYNAMDGPYNAMDGPNWEDSTNWCSDKFSNFIYYAYIRNKLR